MPFFDGLNYRWIYNAFSVVWLLIERISNTICKMLEYRLIKKLKIQMIPRFNIYRTHPNDNYIRVTIGRKYAKI